MAAMLIVVVVLKLMVAVRAFYGGTCGSVAVGGRICCGCSEELKWLYGSINGSGGSG